VFIFYAQHVPQSAAQYLASIHLASRHTRRRHTWRQYTSGADTPGVDKTHLTSTHMATLAHVGNPLCVEHSELVERRRRAFTHPACRAPHHSNYHALQCSAWS